MLEPGVLVRMRALDERSKTTRSLLFSAFELTPQGVKWLRGNEWLFTNDYFIFLGLVNTDPACPDLFNVVGLLRGNVMISVYSQYAGEFEHFFEPVIP
jgi:hypothetical protein